MDHLGGVPGSGRHQGPHTWHQDRVRTVNWYQVPGELPGTSTCTRVRYLRYQIPDAIPSNQVSTKIPGVPLPVTASCGNFVETKDLAIFIRD